MIQKAIWICPALCGCEIEMTANWVHDLFQRGNDTISYGHPVPYTISDLMVHAVCAEHDHLQIDPVAENPYFISEEDFINLIEHFDVQDEATYHEIANISKRGYIGVPPNPTNAEKLYIGLYNYSSILHGLDTCQCKIYKVHRRDSEQMEISKREDVTYKCKYHKADNDAHDQALTEHTLKNDVVNQLTETHPDLTKQNADGTSVLDDSKVRWKFDKSRKLQIIVSDKRKTKSLDDTVKNEFTGKNVEVM